MLTAGSGHIVNIASMAGKIGSAKSQVIPQPSMQCLASRIVCGGASKNGVSVTAINPGPIATPFFDKADPSGNYVKNIAWFMLKPEKVVKELIHAIEKNIPEKEPAFCSWNRNQIISYVPSMFDKLGIRYYE